MSGASKVASKAASAVASAAAGAASKLGSGDAQYFEETVTPEKIRKLLNNPSSGHVGVMEKTDGMKYLLAQMSHGRDVSEYFPDVVKNVIVKSVEVKKMVYMYLVHHADANDECRELALLAINSFQRDLADSNQLIRSMALRVMTSIRVRDIVQLQVMAIAKCASDSSAYVRKTAAHSLPKVYALGPDVKPELIDILARLLDDHAVMVIGSAVAAFSEVCPTNYALLHQHFRKLCDMLADVDEWGQVQIMTVLMRYARTQFTTPLARDGHNRESGAAGGAGGAGGSGFYDESSESEEDEPKAAVVAPTPSANFELDPDHLRLLRSTLGLLSSRTPSVVLAVAAVHFHCGRPERDSPANMAIGKALVRILRSPRESQYLVMANIATISEDRPGIFEDEYRHFFVRVGEPGFLRRQKLQILSNIATGENASAILREMESYVRDKDKEFVCCAIRCVGRIASRLPDIADRCLRGLMGLVTSQYEEVVAESVVVIRQLLQRHPEHDDVILTLVRKLNHTRVAAARAAIVWILGEFQAKTSIQPLAPDALRKLAKGFRDEEVVVKTQILNLAVKLALQQPDVEVLQLLMSYVLELARYDVNYDLRDRARMLRALMLGDESMRARAKAMLLAVKPPPAPAQNSSAGLPGAGLDFALGSLSHMVGHVAKGYVTLAQWPEEAPDKTVRDPKATPEEERAAKREKKKAAKALARGKEPKKAKGFYDSTSSEDESSTSSSSDESSSDGSSSSDDGSSSDESSSDGSGSGSGSESDDGDELEAKGAEEAQPAAGDDDPGNGDEAASATPEPTSRPAALTAASGDSHMFDAPVDSPGAGGSGPAEQPALLDLSGAGGAATESTPVQVLDHEASGGLHADAVYGPSARGDEWTQVELRLNNRSEDATFANVRIADGAALADDQELGECEPVAEVAPGGLASASFDARFGASGSLSFELATDSGAHAITLAPAAES